jgi:hypothetical protein
MTSSSAGPAGPSSTNPVSRAPPGTGHFMLTLCRLDAPVSIRPPQSPQLKPFTFFTSRERERDGSEHLYLHMGYFETLADAERWVEGVRGRFPEAIATIAPAACSRSAHSEAAACGQAENPAAAPQSGDRTPAKDASLSDTQVLKILETRGTSPVQDDTDKRACDQIKLLRPEDTGTREALKEAVAAGAPVSFAVQLQWSAQPIDVSRVPALVLFKEYTLYVTESRREGSIRYFLRLGFFADPISAKQAAAQVRSKFASAAVVPVAEEETTRARAASQNSSSIPSLVQQQGASTSGSNGTSRAPAESEPRRDTRRRASRGPQTLEQALKQLARQELRRQLARGEMWTNPDPLSESGVHHLKVEVEQRKSGRS